MITSVDTLRETADWENQWVAMDLIDQRNDQPMC